MKRERIWAILLITLGLLNQPSLQVNFDESSESSDTSENSEDKEEDPNAEKPKPYDFELKCNRGFLNAYGIDGVEQAHANGMTLCEEVQYSCCSPIDELKFHKNWYGYYELKLRETHTRMTNTYKRLAEVLTFFKELPVKEHKKVIKNGRFKEAEAVHKELEKGGIDPELHPILDALEHLNKRDHKDKKGVFCMFCDFDNHEFLGLSGGTLMIHQKSCEDVVGEASLMLQIRNKLLQPLIMLVHKLLGLYAVDYYDRIEWDLVKEARLHMDLVNHCFPTENAPFELERCIGICERFNVIENSEIIFGEYELYSYLIGRVNMFEQWLPKALENPKKHVKQWVHEDELEEEEKEGEDGKEGEAGEGEEGGEEVAEETKIKKRILSSKKSRKRKRRSSLRLSEEDHIELINHNHERILSLKGLKQLAKRKRKKLHRKQKKGDSLEDKIITEKILKVERQIRRYKTSIHKMKSDNRKLMKRVTSNRKNINRQIKKSLQKEKAFFADPVENRKVGFNPPTIHKHKRKSLDIKRKRKRTSPDTRHLNTEAPANETATETEAEEESIIYKPRDELPQENQDCQNCASSIGSVDSSDIEDSEFIYRSQRIKNSKFLEDSMDCVDCSHGIELKNCTNVTHSNFTSDSKHVTKSINVTNSTYVSNSTFVANSKKVEDSSKITNSTNVKISRNCVDCHNCFNCTACKNVTNCSNCHNVTDSVNVTNAVNSTKIFNSTDIVNGYNLTNATNMTNASNCANCSDRSDCTGKTCTEPIKTEFEIALENKLYYTTMEIVERLYEMTNVGDATSYLENEDEWDPYLYRANNFLYDLSRFRSIFDEDGIVLDFRTTEDFVKDKGKVVEAAIQHFLKNDTMYKHQGIKIGKVDAEIDEFDVRIADLVNFNSDFLSVHNFLKDAQSGVISFKALQGKSELEVQAYDEYLEVIGHEEGGGIVECEEGSGGFEDCLNKKRMIEMVLREETIKKQEEELQAKEAEAQKDVEGEDAEGDDQAESKEEN
jgi:hypothetical protein